MQIELTKEEMEIIEGWYVSAADESRVGQTTETFALLDKLGIKANEMHLFCTNLDDVYAEYREHYRAKAGAVRAYRDRHPEYEGADNDEHLGDMNDA